MTQTQKNIKYDQALKLYLGSFENYPSIREQLEFQHMFWGTLESPIDLPKPPPQGWVDFNNKLGGIPTFHAYSPYPEKI